MGPGKILALLLVIGVAVSASAQVEDYELAIPGTRASIEMVGIPGGSMQVVIEGDTNAVTLSEFWMSKYEITNAQFAPFRHRDQDKDVTDSVREYSADAVTRPTPPYLDFTHGMGNDDDYPAVSMTQQAALRYCKWLYDKTGVFYRLPTELEWEYACNNAGESELVAEVWFIDNSGERYHSVGSKAPNALGLHDMLGNVAEYTADQFHKEGYMRLDLSRPHQLQTTPKSKYFRTVRGGAYDDDAEDCTCAHRIPSNPAWQQRDPQIPKSIWWNPDSQFVGFRVVRPAGDYTAEQVNTYFEKAIVD